MTSLNNDAPTKVRNHSLISTFELTVRKLGVKTIGRDQICFSSYRVTKVFVIDLKYSL